MASRTATAKKIPAKTTAKATSKTQPKAKAKPVAKTVLKTVAKKPVAKLAVKKPVAKAPVKAVKKPVAKMPVKAPAKVVAKNTAKAAVKNVVKTAKDVKAARPANTPAAKPVSKVTKLPTPQPLAAPKAVAAVKPAAAKVPKNDNTSYEYKAGDKVVYPAHGVGCVEGIEKLTVGGIEVTLYTITFQKDRMRLKLPMQKVATSGLRRLANKQQLDEVYSTMKGRARIKRVMWSRRAQEYEAKINSGNPMMVAEVLRDLKRNVSSTEHSYSERQIFQQALERLASELAAIENTDQERAAAKLQTMLVEAA